MPKYHCEIWWFWTSFKFLSSHMQFVNFCLALHHSVNYDVLERDIISVLSILVPFDGWSLLPSLIFQGPADLRPEGHAWFCKENQGK